MASQASSAVFAELDGFFSSPLGLLALGAGQVAFWTITLGFPQAFLILRVELLTFALLVLPALFAVSAGDRLLSLGLGVAVPSSWAALAVLKERYFSGLWIACVIAALFGHLSELSFADWKPIGDGAVAVWKNELSPGARIGIALGVVSAIIFAADYLRLLGFPPVIGRSDDSNLAGAVRKVRLFDQFVTLGILSAAVFSYAVPLFSPMLAVAIAAAVAWGAVQVMRYVAASSYDAVPVARGGVPRPADEALAYVHFTDVHLTDGSAGTAEGGEGGNRNLQSRVDCLAEAAPRLVLVTGDVTDTGSEAEWNQANGILAPLVGKHGCTVVAAPGNHDLSAAYTAEGAVAFAQGQHYRIAPVWLNGQRMRRYLWNAAGMAPALRDASGARLSDVLAREQATFDRTWRLIEGVHAALSSGAGPAEQALDEFAREAQAMYPGGQPGMGWKRLALETSRESFESRFIAGWYHVHWHRYFPLQLTLEDTAVVVLNSVAQELTLLKSAWGELGAEQTSRLATTLETLEGASVFVLVHHSPFRWHDEPRPTSSRHDVQRWAGLAMLRGPALDLVEVLRRARRSGKEVTMFCGHRHGDQAHASRIGVWPGGRIAEGASLAEAGAPGLGAWRGRGGRLRLAALPGLPA